MGGAVISGSTGVSGGAGSSGGVGISGGAGSSGGVGISGGAGASGGAGVSGGVGISGGAGSSGGVGISGGAGSSGGVGISGWAGSSGGVGISGGAGASGGAQDCAAIVDLAFLLDGSGSIGPGNFQKCLEFLKDFVQGFNIAKDGTHIGIVLYSKTSEIIFNFDTYFDAKSMIEAIAKISYPALGTFTGEGLNLVRTGLFDVSARQGVRNILIVMTDGASQVRILDEKIFI